MQAEGVHPGHLGVLGTSYVPWAEVAASICKGELEEAHGKALTKSNPHLMQGLIH